MQWFKEKSPNSDDDVNVEHGVQVTTETMNLAVKFFKENSNWMFTDRYSLTRELTSLRQELEGLNSALPRESKTIAATQVMLAKFEQLCDVIGENYYSYGDEITKP